MTRISLSLRSLEVLLNAAPAAVSRGAGFKKPRDRCGPQASASARHNFLEEILHRYPEGALGKLNAAKCYGHIE